MPRSEWERRSVRGVSLPGDLQQAVEQEDAYPTELHLMFPMLAMSYTKYPQASNRHHRPTRHNRPPDSNRRWINIRGNVKTSNKR